ncbi:putrescine transport system substrate-binding protein [Rhodoligotrophos appendicifer]|uniref:polyamine ABC transporter substrate-binding protein n=1 Tax=Rhodoligotrophos appendicifer TaxID=987056 RepID=UPI00117E2D4D|nr:polyamine ABC transporter substrate-binding protein [Rhodoligotrophos appendicifer]
MFAVKSFASAMMGMVIGLGFAPASAQEEKVVNVYNWADYIGETTLKDFEEATGIKVVYDTYDASETVDAKLLAGRSGYDVVLHSSSFIPRLIQAGIVQKLDKAALTGWSHLDPELIQKMEAWDPGNQYAVPYMWGTAGVTYNTDMVSERIKDAPYNSLDMLFKEEYSSKLADCGISILDSPTDIVPMVLSYLGKDPQSENPEDFDAVVAAFQPIRKYIKTFDSANYLNALPNKELCMVFNWSGDYATATQRAEDAKVEINLAYYVPSTGSPAWFDAWIVPADAPHAENAMKFINFLLDPKAIADATNFTYYANANKDAVEFVNKDILNDPAVYPTPELMKRLWNPHIYSQKGQRALTRAWSRIKTGQ